MPASERGDSNMPESDLNENKDHGQSAEAKIGRGRTGVLSPLTLLLLVVCLAQFGLLAVLTLGSRPASGFHSPPPAQRPPATASPQEPYFSGHPGPWGNLEYARISLEPPDAFIPADANFFGPTHWFFEGYT